MVIALLFIYLSTTILNQAYFWRMHLDYCKLFTLIFLLKWIPNIKSDSEQGPDPWDLTDFDWQTKSQNDENIPPDLRIPQKKPPEPIKTIANSEWFFRRILNIILKGGQMQKNEDNSVDVLLKIKLSTKQWDTMDEFLKSNNAFTEDNYRRILGYIEEAIQPTIAEKIVVAWTEYIEFYLAEYKDYITWTLAITAIGLILMWLWKRMSHRHFVIALLVLLYMYEVFVSYKEAEQQELDRFLSAIDSCRWRFWSSHCNVPKPDPVKFFKHMNPMRIGIRMFTNIISEPFITLSDTMKVIVHGMTEGLWYPFDKIMYGILILSLNVLMLILLIMIVFNFIFNIPFNLSFFGVGLGVPQRNRNIFTNSTCTHNVENVDRISGATLDRLLDVFSRALPVAQNNNNTTQRQISFQSSHGMRRSASTGRLCDKPESSYSRQSYISRKDLPRKRNIQISTPTDGSGDAH